jgi:transcriptional regulator with XRE-family HTH domain
VSFKPALLSRAARQTLIEARRDAGVTQLFLSRRLGWAQSAISRIESGQRTVGLVEFILIAEALRVDPQTLVQRVLARQ